MRQAASSSRCVIVSSPTSPLKGRVGELPLPPLSLGEALPPPDPHPIVERAKALSPPLVVVAGLTFLEGTPRQFSPLALAGRRGELPRQPSSSLAGSRRQPAWPAVVVRRHGVVPSRPKGRTGQLVPPLSSGVGSKLPTPLELGLRGFPQTRASPGSLLCHVRASRQDGAASCP